MAEGLFRHGGLKSGQSVLIHGGSGGVGHFAIQFAKAKGAHVITTVSADHVAFAQRLGAEQVIDYKKQRFEDAVKDVDVVFDLVGGETQDRSWGVLKKGGVLVSTLAQPSQAQAAAHQARGLRYTAQESGADLAEIATAYRSGAGQAGRGENLRAARGRRGATASRTGPYRRENRPGDRLIRTAVGALA